MRVLTQRRQMLGAAFYIFMYEMRQANFYACLACVLSRVSSWRIRPSIRLVTGSCSMEAPGIRGLSSIGPELQVVVILKEGKPGMAVPE
jgi:hypothetical protein